MDVLCANETILKSSRNAHTNTGKAAEPASRVRCLRIYRQCSTLSQESLTTTTLSNPSLPELPGLVEQEANWLAAARAAVSKKAVKLVVLDLREVTSFTDYFVICTALNARQGQAISNGIHGALKELGELPVSFEGFDRAEWVLMDYGDFLVHVFSEHARSFYDLERLWRHGKVVDVPSLTSEIRR